MQTKRAVGRAAAAAAAAAVAVDGALKKTHMKDPKSRLHRVTNNVSAQGEVDGGRQLHGCRLNLAAA